MKSPIEVFSDWAKDGRDEKMAHGHAESVKAMLDFVIAKLPSPFTFIDAGCGNGWVVQMVGDKKNCKKAIGVDGSQLMIDKAKSVDAIHDYHCEDLMDWFPIQKVDCVFSMEVFYYVDKPHLLLKNIRSDWLKNNGRIIMGIDYYTENPPSKSWSKDCGISTMIRLTELEWIECFRLAGFQDIQSWRQGKKDDWSGTLIISALK